MKTPWLTICTGLCGAFVLSAFAAASHAAPVDDSRVRQVEMDLRALQLLVDQQARRIDALESALRLPRAGRSPLPSTPVPPANKSAATVAWLQSANWDKLAPGMSEADVVRVLGPPTTTRRSENGNAQTMFYALELDAGGFLSGNVVLADQRVLEIHKPALK